MAGVDGVRAVPFAGSLADFEPSEATDEAQRGIAQLYRFFVDRGWTLEEIDNADINRLRRIFSVTPLDGPVREG